MTDAANRRIQVLVVDDDEAVAGVVGRVLEQEYEVRVVFGVNDALRAIEVRVPDLIVTDLQMPGRNGDELLFFVALNYPRVLRVIHSGGTPAERGRLLTQRLAHAAVEKPSSADVLRATVRRLVDSHLIGTGAGSHFSLLEELHAFSLGVRDRGSGSGL